MEKNTLQNSLKEFSQTSGTNANDVKEFFALMSDGSIKRMPKEDMATVLGGLLPDATPQKRGLMPINSFFIDKHLVDGEYNESLTPGVYSHGNIGNGVSTGTLAVFRGQRYIVHVDFGVDCNIRIKILRSTGELLNGWRILNSLDL